MTALKKKMIYTTSLVPLQIVSMVLLRSQITKEEVK